VGTVGAVGKVNDEMGQWATGRCPSDSNVIILLKHMACFNHLTLLECLKTEYTDWDVVSTPQFQHSTILEP
jgi:hypothetical protein